MILIADRRGRARPTGFARQTRDVKTCCSRLVLALLRLAEWKSVMVSGGDMVDLDGRMSRLKAQRQGLLNQLAALDQAIAGLAGTPSADVDHRKDAARETVERVASPRSRVIPTRIKANRTLSESHQQALTAGRRKAREAKDVAAGLAREMPDESFVPALAPRSGSQPPRLVKRRLNQPSSQGSTSRPGKTHPTPPRAARRSGG